MDMDLSPILEVLNRPGVDHGVLERRAALLQLQNILQNSKVVNEISSEKRCNWGEVVRAVINAQSKEIAYKRRSWNKQLRSSEVDPLKTLKRVVETADQGEPRLYTCATELVTHITEVLREVDHYDVEYNELYLPAVILIDYCTVLGHFLNVPGYCLLIPSGIFMELSSTLANVATAAAKDGQNSDVSVVRCAADQLSALMRSYPFDIPAAMTKDLHDFFITFLTTDSFRGDSQPINSVLIALNQLLTSTCVNFVRMARHYSENLNLALITRWTKSKDERIRKEIIRFLRLQLVLALTPTGQRLPLAHEDEISRYLHEHWEALSNPVSSVVLMELLEGDQTNVQESEMVMLARFFAELLLHIFVSKGISDSSLGEKSPKQQCRTWQALLENVTFQTKPNWLVILFFLLRLQDRHALTDILYHAFMVQLTSILERSLEQVQLGKAESDSRTELDVWALACLLALARLPNLARRFSADWKKTFGVVARKAMQRHIVASNSCLHVLEHLLGLGLPDLVDGSVTDLCRVLSSDGNLCTSVALSFITKFVRLCDGGSQLAELRPQLLMWVLRWNPVYDSKTFESAVATWRICVLTLLGVECAELTRDSSVLGDSLAETRLKNVMEVLSSGTLSSTYLAAIASIRTLISVPALTATTSAPKNPLQNTTKLFELTSECFRQRVSAHLHSAQSVRRGDASSAVSACGLLIVDYVLLSQILQSTDFPLPFHDIVNDILSGVLKHSSTFCDFSERAAPLLQQLIFGLSNHPATLSQSETLTKLLSALRQASLDQVEQLRRTQFSAAQNQDAEELFLDDKDLKPHLSPLAHSTLRCSVALLFAQIPFLSHDERENSVIATWLSITASPLCPMPVALETFRALSANPDMSIDSQRRLAENFVSFYTLARTSGGPDVRAAALELLATFLGSKSPLSSPDSRARIYQLLPRIIKDWSDGKMSWYSRVLLCRAIRSLQCLPSTQPQPDPSLDNELTELFKKSVLDPDFRVRIYMSQAITVLLELYDKPVNVADTIWNLSASAVDQSEEYLLSVCTAAVNISLTSVDTTAYVVARLMQIASTASSRSRNKKRAFSADDIKAFAEAAIATILQRGTGASLPAFAADHIADFIQVWNSAGADSTSSPDIISPLQYLERQAGTQNNAPSFISRFSGVILARLFAARQTTAAEEVAKLANSSLRKLLEGSFAPIFAAVLVRCASVLILDEEQDPQMEHHDPSSSGAALPTATKKRISSSDSSRKPKKPRVNALYRAGQELEPYLPLPLQEKAISASTDQIISSVIGLLSVGDDHNAPYYPAKVITLALNELTQSLGSDALDPATLISQLLGSPRDRISKLLLGINIDFAKANVASRKLIVLNRLRFLSKHLSQLWQTRIHLVRDVLFTVLRFLHDRARVLYEPACELLLVLCSEWINAGASTRNEVGKYLGNIIQVLAPNYDTIDCAQKLLNLLVISSKAHLKAYLAQVEPFPDIPSWSALNAALLSVRVERSLTDELEHFLALPRSTAGRPIVIRRLRERLEADPDKLSLLSQESTSIRDCVARIVWQLAQLAAQYSDRSCDLAWLLGYLTAVHPSLLDETKPFLVVDISPDRLPTLKANIVKQLMELITDVDVECLTAASMCLTAVLLTRSGQEARQKLDEGEQMNLYPFRTFGKDDASSKIQLVQEMQQSCILDPSGLSYESWICELCVSVTCFLSDEFLRLLGPVCRIRYDFCELVFLDMVFDALTSSRKFAQDFGHVIARYLIGGRANDASYLQTTNRILQLCNYLRAQYYRQEVSPTSSHVIHSLGIDVSFYILAETASTVDANLHSLLFLELHFENESAGVLEVPKSSQLNYAKLARAIFPRLDDEDMLSAVDALDTGVNEVQGGAVNSSNRSVGYYNSLLQACSTSPAPALVERLVDAARQDSLDHLLRFYLKGNTAIVTQSRKLLDRQFEIAWRCGDWAFSEQFPEPRSEDVLFNAAVHSLCKAFHLGESVLFGNTLRIAQYGAVRSLGQLSLESSNEFYSALSKLQLLLEIGFAWGCVRSQKPFDHSALERFLNRSENSVFTAHFDRNEQRASLHTVLWRLLGFTTGLNNTLLRLANVARKAGRTNAAMNAVAALYERNEKISPAVVLEEAKIRWRNGEQSVALKMTQNLCRSISSGTLLAATLLARGKWLAKAMAAPPRQIIDDCLLPAIKMFGSRSFELAKALFTLASYEDKLHQSLVLRSRSPEYATLQQLRQERKDELSRCVAAASSASKHAKEDLSRQIAQLTKQVEADRAEQLQVEAEERVLLMDAISHYTEVLLLDSRYDLRAVFRLMALWFANTSLTSVNNYLHQHLPRVNSSKFLPLIYQISSRLSCEVSPPDSFQRAIGDILERVALQSPQSVMFQLFALSNTPSGAIDPDKAKAARKLIDRTRTVNAKLVQSFGVLIEAYTELAFVDAKVHKNKSTAIGLPANLKIRKIDNLQLVPVPTSRGSSLPSIVGFVPSYTLAGGINLPKIIECIGSDGRHYKQLVKANDDLRQDAVMQQIFSLVNVLLRENPASQKRQLHVRGYNVIPLSSNSGVLEWVSNTIPLSEWLIGRFHDPRSSEELTGGAHRRYRAQDISHTECRQLLTDASEALKMRVYEDIKKRFKPVFHHFFLERFLHPVDWFEKRTRYTRSVASNSIVGFIVGLGDRHSSNILIDKNTAELVHIDLGVAFDQGKLLRTPEVVPFRLTRDIVDAMGITGTEGVFRRCCEETLRVLRHNHHLLLTIVEVFLHDPLYKWTLSPLKNAKAADVNHEAEHTLLRLQEKLSAVASGEQLSVSGHVGQLINEATADSKLSRMFPGWAPYL